ncbi:MAG: hypothetical protein M0R06_14845 [Sphaerochaeta sp.]|jgi:hypothetical protein|nr:hypothetical protein [Sphaerochaeta sp.]
MRREYHLWIVTKDPETGKPYLIYGCPDRNGEDECRAKGIEMLGGLNFEIRRYPTRSLSEASAFHRGKRLESGEGLKASTQRLGHEKSVERMMRAKRRRLGL